MNSRAVSWGSLENAWDLGGQPSAGGTTLFGRVYRSMSPDRLDAAGWADVVTAGVATIVDLRNDDEVLERTSRPGTIVVYRRPVENQADEDFMLEWGERLGSPGYYSEVLRRWPDFIAAAFAAIAEAPGPVLFHCGAGRDRTGMIAAMIGELVGVARAAILDDYEAAVRAYNSWLVEHPNHETSLPEPTLTTRLASSRRELEEFLDAFDFERYLLDAGVSPHALATLRSRLLTP